MYFFSWPHPFGILKLFYVFSCVKMLLLEVGVLLLVDFHDIMVGMDAASNILLFFLYTRIA